MVKLVQEVGDEIMGLLHIITGDIISESKNMDAIVNPQNKYMTNGSGVCGAIYRASGIELLKYYKDNYNTNMSTCEVRITPGFNLNMDIIHALAPVYGEWDNPIDKLIETYKNILNTITEKKYTKIIIPSLGCGYFGFKHEDVAEQVIGLLSNYCRLYDVDIYFVNLYSIYTDIYLKVYLKLNAINLKQDIQKLNNQDIIDYLKTNGLYNNNIKEKYSNFIKDKELNELCLEDKVMCLQYTCEFFDIDKIDLTPLTENLEN